MVSTLAMGTADKFVPWYLFKYRGMYRGIPRDNVKDTYALRNACCHTSWPNSIHYCYIMLHIMFRLSLNKSSTTISQGWGNRTQESYSCVIVGHF